MILLVGTFRSFGIRRKLCKGSLETINFRGSRDFMKFFIVTLAMLSLALSAVAIDGYGISSWAGWRPNYLKIHIYSYNHFNNKLFIL
jgi:hypothetical protein